MKHGIPVFGVMCMLICLLGLPMVAPASPPLVEHAVRYSLEPTGTLHVGDPTQFRFIFSRNQDYSYTQLKTSITADGLRVIGQSNWLTEFKGDEVCTTLFELVIPAHDTSGFAFNIDCGVAAWPSYRYFVTTGDSVEYYTRNLRAEGFPWYSHDGIPELGIPPSPLSPEELAGADSSTQDAGGVGSTRRLSREEAMRADMRKMELKPHLSPNRQVIWLENEIWVRDSGEYKFHREEGETLPRGKKTRKPSGEIVADVRNEYEVLLDLTDSADYRFASSVLQELKPTGNLGFYRAVTDKATLTRIEKQGINFKILLTSTSNALESTGNSDTAADKTESDADSHLESRASPDQTIYFDDFETGDLWGWDVYDENPASGADYWGGVYQAGYSGLWSVWCSESEDYTGGTYYDNDMWAVMESWPAVNLAGYSNRRISYMLKYHTEPNYGSVFWYESTSGYTWMLRAKWNGNSNGWKSISDLIYTVADDYYTKFVFYSDGSVYQYPGAFIDDFTLTGNQIALPNLTYDWPGGWSWPLVASPQAGTHTSAVPTNIS